MCKITIKSFKIIIEPEVSPGLFKKRSEEDMANEQHEICKQILADVKRHVDNAESARIERVELEVCNYCAREWEVDKDNYPTCCQQAVRNHELSLLSNTNKT